jgi:hypothetical protein
MALIDKNDGRRKTSEVSETSEVFGSKNDERPVPNARDLLPTDR